MDDQFIDDYDVEHVNKMLMNTEHMNGYEEGLEEGRQEGIEQGEKSKSIEIAKNLFKNAMSIENISKNVNIPVEELKEILDTNK